MRRLAVLIAVFIVLVPLPPALAVTASMRLEPTAGPANEQFTAIFTMNYDEPCPTGEPVAFDWTSPRARTPLGTSQLVEVAPQRCRATLRATPPATDREPGTYTVCATYTTSAGQTIAACDDYAVEPATSSPPPGGTPATSPPQSPGGTASPGSTIGPGSTPDGTKSPSPADTAEPEPTPTGEPSPAEPAEEGGLPAAPVAAGAVGLLGIWIIAHAARITRSAGDGH